MEKLTRFDERTGIVKLNLNDEEWFVVYCYFFDLPPLNHLELGMAISKGKTVQEALSKAVIKLTKKIIEVQNNLDIFEEKIIEVRKILPREGKDEIVIGERLTETRWNNELQTHEYFEGEEVNADIGIDEEGEIFSTVF